MRQKRLMTLVHLWLLDRYKADSVHYVSPKEESRYQAAKTKSHGLFATVNTEVGQIIVADADHARVEALLSGDRVALGQLIRKEG